ncbi:hypothetical protein K431DRAFT_281124 [Polychaeton citri CBS 116435]|uniref:Telomeric single stranded DNA binding POT1/Cdc13 domain-containing protein n=1 Tax=Polychaeton citri CBS 116435 TaxID=1314669 RepID=A0A9P4QHU6_9PEZI|nr:hypothetical protein K431DRAFT_281124 [Polychaeton citri CBS 116435]
MKRVPIQSLDISSAPSRDSSIRAVITLSWPYSISTRQCALLLADPDFRLRNRRGQVRTRFSGRAAEAIAQSRLGIGDEVVLELDGASWVEDGSTVKTPGRSVGAELAFEKRLRLRVARNGGEVDIEVDAPPSPQRSPGRDVLLGTPISKPLPALHSALRSSLGPPAEGPVYSSPAFARRIRTADRDSPELELDPFADDDFETSPRKRQRVSFGYVRNWRLAGYSPSPIKSTASDEDLANEEAHEDKDGTERITTSIGPNDRPVVHATEPSLAALPSASPYSERSMRQDLVNLTETTPTKPSRAAASNYNIEDATLYQSFSVPAELQILEQAQQRQGSPRSRAEAEMPPPPLPRLRMPSPQFLEGAVMIEDETERPKTPKLQPVSGASLPLPSPFPTETSQQPMFPEPVSFGHDQAYDTQNHAGDAELVPTHLEGEPSLISPAGIEAQHTSPDDVVLVSAPSITNLGVVSQSMNGDSQDEFDQGTVDTKENDYESTMAFIEPDDEPACEEPPYLTTKPLSEESDSVEPATTTEGVTVSATEELETRSPYDQPVVSSQSLPKNLSTETTTNPALQDGPLDGIKRRGERINKQTFRTLFGYTTAPDVELLEGELLPEKAANPWMTEEEKEALATMVIDKEMPFRQSSPIAQAVEDSEPASEDEDGSMSSTLVPQIRSVSDGQEILHEPQQEDAAGDELPSMEQESVLNQPQLSFESGNHEFIEELMDEILVQGEGTKDMTDVQDASRDPATDVLDLVSSSDDGAEAAPVQVAEAQQELLPMDNPMEGVETTSVSQNIDHADTQVEYNTSQTMEMLGGIVEQAHDIPSGQRSLVEEQIPDTTVFVKDGAQSNPVMLFSSPPHSPDHQTTAVGEPTVTSDPVGSAVGSSLVRSPSSPRSTMVVEAPDGNEVATPSSSTARQTQEPKYAQHLLHQTGSAVSNNVDTPLTTLAAENSRQASQEGDSILSNLAEETYLAEAAQRFVVDSNNLSRFTQDVEDVVEAPASAQPNQETDLSLSKGKRMSHDYSQVLDESTASQQVGGAQVPDESLLQRQQNVTLQPSTPTKDQTSPTDTAAIQRGVVERDNNVSGEEDTNVSDMTSSIYQQETSGFSAPTDLEAQVPVVERKSNDPLWSPIHSQSQDDTLHASKAQTSVEHSHPILPLTPQHTQQQSSTRSVEKMSEQEDGLAPISSMEAKTPSRYSLRSRLSNIPDVISAWFTPKRTGISRESTDHKNIEIQSSPESPSRLVAKHETRSSGYSTAKAYFTPLSNLEDYMNVPNQAFGGNKIDVLALVTDSTKLPSRAKAGPRDFFTIFRITDASLPSANSMRVEVFRPWRAVLPAAEAGDVVLLRAFTVMSRKRQPYLLSTDESAWCVWRFENGSSLARDDGKPVWARKSNGNPPDVAKEEVKGPPVEFGDEERERAMRLHMWWKGEQSLPDEA